MLRPLFGALTCCLVFAGPLPAQEGILRGTIKKIDADKGTLTITSAGKDYDVAVTEETKFFDGAMGQIKDRLKDKHFKVGATIMFKADKQGDRLVLAGIKLVGAAGNPGQGTIKKIDADKGTLTIATGGKDYDVAITEKTIVQDRDNRPVQDGLKDKRFKQGARVQFRVAKEDDRLVLAAIKLADFPPLVKVDTSKLQPLTELGTGKHKDFEGGLYPGGKNERPAAHDKAGLALARKIQPLDAEGKPSADGKIVLLSVGMSNTTQEFSTFKRLADKDEAKNPHLAIVDGAQGGMTAAVIQDPDRGRGKQFWDKVDERLKDASVTREQVQVAWLKEADAGPRDPFPKHAQTLHAELRRIVRLMHDRFPNLKIIYLSSRICAAFAKTPLNPEPIAYETGFSVKWLIEEQIKGDKAFNYDPAKGKVQAPWLSWGPYLWTNGVAKRADGLTYEESDFAGDGTHPAPAGQRKVADHLMHFFKTDATAKEWFVRR
jgi:Cu/Ag efflux protein CusF